MNLNLVDVHCHLDHELFKNDLAETLQRARTAGVKVIITSGVNPAANRIALELADKYKPLVKCALGLYPIDALGLEPDESGLASSGTFDVDEELAFIAKNKDKIAAVGEAGLDYKVVNDPVLIKKQQENFKKIIALCEKIKKPLIIHSRKAEKDCIDILETSKLKKVNLHCFEGNKNLIKRATDLGYSFSIPTHIVRLQHFQTLGATVPIDHLLTETDAPWLTPFPGKRNEPAHVLETIKKIAEIKGFTIDETANSIFMNYQRMF